MTWISAAELSRRAGVSRAAVTNAIKAQRIPPAAVRRAANRVMVEENAGLAGILKRGETAAPAPTRPTTAAPSSLFAWGSTAAPAPEPAAAPAPQPEPEPEPDDSAAALEEWATAYAALRKWLLHGCSTGFSGAMWAALGEQPAIGTVMVTAAELIGAQLAQLDRLATEHACRMRPNEWRTWR